MTKRRNVRIFAYNPESESARNLGEALGVKRLRHTGPPALLKWKTVINYGCSSDKYFHDRKMAGQPVRIVNLTTYTDIAANKLSMFQFWRGLGDYCPRIPHWCVEKSQALEWINDDDMTVVARKSLTGHSGYGIMVVEEPDELPDAPLYVEYIPKKEEYRVHFAFGNIIDVQRKVKRSDYNGTVDWRVRNHAGGFVYIRNDINPAPDVLEQATKAFKPSGLDFGACDVIWNAKRKKAYVLEINTAPGITGPTVEKYKEAFIKELELTE